METRSPEPDEHLEPSRDRAEGGQSLASRSSAGEVIGGMLATLDQALTNRPRPVTQIQEEYREPWASADGVTVQGLDEQPDRPEPPDGSGARV